MTNENPEKLSQGGDGLRKQVEAYDRFVEGGGDFDQESIDRGWQVPRLVHEELREKLEPGQKLLDIGCGTGLSAEPFKDDGLEMRGVDGSAGLLKVADEKQLYSLGTEQAFVGQDEIESNHDYNYVVSFGAISVIPDAKKELLSTMQKSVAPGGTVAFNYLDPDDYPDATMVQRGDDLVDVGDGGQQDRFFHRQRDITEACEQLNFVPVKEIHTVSYPLREEGRQNPTRIMIARYEP